MAGQIDFKLILITESGEDIKLYKIISLACRAGVKAVQLREKNIPANELLIHAKKLREITKKYRSKLLVNDRYDIALLSRADGLHSPEHGIFPEQFKHSKKFIIGKSVHSVKSAVNAEYDGYDYIIFGPVYRTPRKIKYGKPQGLDKLKKVCSTVNIPVFAVGGINPLRAKKCIISGAYGVAVIREIMNSNNVRKTINEFKASMGYL